MIIGGAFLDVVAYASAVGVKVCAASMAGDYNGNLYKRSVEPPNSIASIHVDIPYMSVIMHWRHATHHTQGIKIRAIRINPQSQIRQRSRQSNIGQFCTKLESNVFNPNRSLGFMSDWYLFRTDWLHHWRRRSGLRQDRDVDKMPKEMLIWHE